MFRMTFSLLDAESTATLLLVLKKDTYSRVNDFFGEPDSGPPAALYLLDFGHRRRTTIVSTMSLIGFTSSVTETNNTTVIVSGIVTHGPPTSRLFIGLLPAFYDSDQCQSCEKESTSCGFCHKMVNLKSILGSPQHVRLAVSTRILDCLYWNSHREVWTNTACKVEYIGVHCNHLITYWLIKMCSHVRAYVCIFSSVCERQFSNVFLMGTHYIVLNVVKTCNNMARRQTNKSDNGYTMDIL